MVNAELTVRHRIEARQRQMELTEVHLKVREYCQMVKGSLVQENACVLDTDKKYIGWRIFEAQKWV